MTTVLKLSLMGGMQMEMGDQPLSGLTSAKAQALLCYLAVASRPVARPALAALLWGRQTEADGRRNLRGVIMRLRQAVGAHLLVDHQTIAFNRSAEFWVDVELFESLLAHRPDEAVPTEDLVEAVALYRGDFLEDLYVRDAPEFESWVTGWRSRLKEQALEAMLELSKRQQALGSLEAAIGSARRMLGMDPVREEGWRQLMALLAFNGQRSVALAEYDRCRTVLERELGVTPAADTERLVAMIREGTLIPQPSHVPPSQRTGSQIRSTVTQSASDGVRNRPAFVVGPPITHPRQFFGREREVKRLFNMLKRRPLQNAAVIGPRRSGKTSLLHYLQKITTLAGSELRTGQRQDWLPDPAGYRWIFVDFQDPRLGSAEALLRHLLQNMDLPVPEPCDMENFMDTVSEGLHNPTVVLLDEIGVAFQRYPELDDAFWEGLRSLATNQVDGNLGFILAGPESPEKLARYGGLGSPFFNIFGYMADLGPLSEPEARELIASAPHSFSAEDVDWIIEHSGRWPILLQILCRELLLALEEEGPGDEWRQEGLRQIAPFQRALMEPADQ